MEEEGFTRFSQGKISETLTLEGFGHTIGNLVVKDLQRNEEVEFSGYKRSDESNSITLTVVSDNPRKHLKSTISKTISDLDAIELKLRASLKY